MIWNGGCPKSRGEQYLILQLRHFEDRQEGKTSYFQSWGLKCYDSREYALTAGLSCVTILPWGLERDIVQSVMTNSNVWQYEGLNVGSAKLGAHICKDYLSKTGNWNLQLWCVQLSILKSNSHVTVELLPLNVAIWPLYKSRYETSANIFTEHNLL